MKIFVSGVTARTAVDLLGVNRKTAAYFYHRLREIIAKNLDTNSLIDCHVEVDESYFGGHSKGPPLSHQSFRRLREAVPQSHQRN